MAEASNYLDVQPSTGGGIIGARAVGPFFVDPTFGLVLVDKVDGKFYSLTISSGVLGVVEITL